MVTSPGFAPVVKDGMWKRMIEFGRLSEKVGIACTREGSKYLQLQIFFTAAGVARMTVCRSAGSSCRRVSSWQ